MSLSLTAENHSKIFEITIPILNEEKVLERNLRVLLDYLDGELSCENLTWKVTIADNGSSDQSPEIMNNLCKQFQNLDYLRVRKIGVGIALKTAWLRSNADFVGYMDVDLATSLKHLAEVYRALDKDQYDFVYGSRLHRLSKVAGRSLKREITSRSFNRILKSYLGVRFSDGMCGFKFMKREVAHLLMDKGAQSDGWFFSTELMYLAEKLGLKIFELPVVWSDSEESKVNIPKLAWQYLKSMHQIKKIGSGISPS
jgi:glycosyltransferase involved in cell wall biosynthesis